MTAAVVPARQLAHLQLPRELGRCAQAVVWLAHALRLDREVAVQLLSAEAELALLRGLRDQAVAAVAAFGRGAR